MTLHVPPLPPHLEEFLREQVASGRYQSETDLVCAALRQMEERSLPHSSEPDAAFGLWKGREQDGLGCQQTLRDEWGH